MKSRIRVCMIGAGRVGRNHSGNIRRYVGDADLVAMVDPVSAVLQASADEFGIKERYASFQEALENSMFDAVVITTPTFTHRDLALQAAAANKHIFLEKPMALNLIECDEILASVQKAEVLLQIGFMRRFDPEFVTAAQRIAGGEIGRPMMVKSLTHGPGLPPAWARDLVLSNGMLAEVNSHDWDTVRWLMGSNYQRIFVESANFKGETNQITTPDFYDNVVASIRFESGGLGTISGICPCGYGYDARVEIVGDQGIMQIGKLQGQAVIVCTDRDRGLVQPIYRTWPERFAWGYIHEMQHFVECIQTQSQPRASGIDGRWAVAGVLTGTRSLLQGRPVLVEEILKDREVLERKA